MTPSTFIARILGPVLVIVGLGLLLQTEWFRLMANEFLKGTSLVYLTGLISLVLGLAILNTHNLWVRDWRVIITLFGWLALISGIFRLLATSWVQHLGLEAMTHPRGLVVTAVVELVLGGYLTIMGYRDLWGGADGAKKPRAAAAPKPAKAASASAGAAKRPRKSG